MSARKKIERRIARRSPAIPNHAAFAPRRSLPHLAETNHARPQANRREPFEVGC